MGTLKRAKKKLSKQRKAHRSSRHNERGYWVKIERRSDDRGYTKLVSFTKAKSLVSPYIVIGGVLRKKEDIGIPVLWQTC